MAPSRVSDSKEIFEDNAHSEIDLAFHILLFVGDPVVGVVIAVDLINFFVKGESSGDTFTSGLVVQVLVLFDSSIGSSDHMDDHVVPGPEGLGVDSDQLIALEHHLPLLLVEVG